MATAAVIGESLAVEGYALAGVLVYPAETRDQALAACSALPADTGLLLMTASAAGWLASELETRPDVLTAVLAP
jgi:vacuolar-type H+-ATPase subunit F/Vma7